MEKKKLYYKLFGVFLLLLIIFPFSFPGHRTDNQRWVVTVFKLYYLYWVICCFLILCFLLLQSAAHGVTQKVSVQANIYAVILATSLWHDVFKQKGDLLCGCVKLRILIIGCKTAFLPHSLNLPSVHRCAIWMWSINFYYGKTSLTENISSSQVVHTTWAKIEARCPYKTNKEHGDGAAAPQASPRAPQAYLGG